MILVLNSLCYTNVMEARPILIIVSGLPAAGKTHLSANLAKELKLPLFSRDDISETLFDSLRLEPKEWSGIHRQTSYELMWLIISNMLKAGQSLIVESSFESERAIQRLSRLKDFNFEPFQIIVSAEKEVLLGRYRDRMIDPLKSNKTHPVHFAYLTYERYKEKLEAGRWVAEPLDIGGESWQYDTTNLEQLNYNDLVLKISSKLGR